MQRKQKQVRCKGCGEIVILRTSVTGSQEKCIPDKQNAKDCEEGSLFLDTHGQTWVVRKGLFLPDEELFGWVIHRCRH